MRLFRATLPGTRFGTHTRFGLCPFALMCADPHEYIQTLVDLFNAAAFFEKWIEHYEDSQV